jgi:hypothetical protein
MPNRILKESICTSDSIDRLSWFEEVVFYRLIVNCDDYGRFDGRVALIKNKLFPLKESVTFKAVEDAINKLATVGLVTLYEYEGRQYLQLPTWNEHQSIRAKRSKFPSPDGCVKASEIICMQMNANVPVIQSESESNPNPKEGAKAPNARARFSPPSVSDVEAYCRERRNDVDPQRFVDFYASKGWKVGSQPMKDWKAAVRTWEQRGKDERSASKPKQRSLNGAHNHHQRTYTDADLDKIGIDLLGDEDDE